MKLVFYFDVFPWTIGINDIWPSQSPIIPKPIDGIRYKIETEVPDPKQPDTVLSLESVSI
jgi:hypothetical protein